jgi:NADP-dependent aldehyde dehydrogenase
MSTNTVHTEALTGEQYLGAERVAGTGPARRAVDPSTGSELEPEYRDAAAEHLERACALAEAAFAEYRAVDDRQRAEFLRLAADELTARTEALVQRAMRESGLTEARLTGEVARTAGQLRLFAEVLEEGSWHGARIDPARRDRQPLPRADIRQRKIPLGPVAVFGASNFPLAFSVAGGDTASALAAGCPVVVKAHEAHPGTSELAAQALVAAAGAAGMPDGVFSLLFGDGPGVGAALVANPRIAAVGFTGSRAAGLSLVRAAAARPVPIPVYAEMSSINPVLLLPAALANRGAELGTAFVGSLTMGAGQFCTNPGLVLALDGAGLDEFEASARAAVQADAGGTMLTANIARAYADAVEEISGHSSVRVVARGADAGSACGGRAALLATDAASVIADESLRRELFGAASVLVRCRDEAELTELVRVLEGQLTVSVHADEPDLELAGRLLGDLERLAGRIVFDGWPTGVEVGHAMVHGGPYPATSDARSTSVGSLAIERFLRPVAYQDLPPRLRPAELRDENPGKLWRRVDGVLGQH